MNKLEIFKNDRFGEVRVAVSEKGEPIFCLADLCRELGLDASQVMKRLDDGVVSTHPIYDRLNRKQNANFVNEDGMYDVILDSRKPEAKLFRKWITSEILPSIRKTGQYSTQSQLPPQTYSDALRQLADEVEEKEKAQLLLEQKTQQLDESKEWYSLKRVAKLNNVHWKTINWKCLKNTSNYLGYDIKKVFDANYGNVNIYNIDVWKQEYPHFRYK
jgi:prophage antirepressor-like protein